MKSYCCYNVHAIRINRRSNFTQQYHPFSRKKKKTQKICYPFNNEKGISEAIRNSHRKYGDARKISSQYKPRVSACYVSASSQLRRRAVVLERPASDAGGMPARRPDAPPAASHLDKPRQVRLPGGRRLARPARHLQQLRIASSLESYPRTYYYICVQLIMILLLDRKKDSLADKF